MTRLSALLVMLLWSGSPLLGQPIAQPDSPIRLSETYELANIILALTDYGKTDPWEVAQGSVYYQKVRAHFDRYSNHPLLAKVNYSRNEWENYLSFRTDAYAFAFDSGSHLIRRVAFRANKGVNPFEENLLLIEDFVSTTGFRQFYQQQQAYYQGLAETYLTSQHYPEMRQFLETELGKRRETTSYAIVVSPLVGRMNCHRMVAGVGTDFSSLPAFVLTGKAVQMTSEEDIASGTHMLFTELDHAFVNPLTDQHRALVRANFDNRDWDTGSGYQTDSLATFNEYMTWAVYDLFVQHYFPTVAAKISTDWQLQNETRGFYASALFHRELTKLYQNRKPGQTLKNLYPAFIRQLGSLKSSLRKPVIQSYILADQIIRDTTATFVIRFSESMQPLSALEIVWVVKQHETATQQQLLLTPEQNGLIWSDAGRTVRFTVRLASHALNTFMFNYAWKTRTPLRSRNGIDLPPYSQVMTSRK